MIVTTDAYKTAIKERSRVIIPKVDIYFDGEANSPVIFYASDVGSFNIIEEAQAEGYSPLGSVSFNECTITLSNRLHRFTPIYASSPYYGKMVPNMKIVPYLGIELADTSYEYIKMGTFWTGNWSAPTDSLDATVVCYDRLYLLMDKDVPLIPTNEDLTRYEAFETLFKALGIAGANYNIDTALQDNTVDVVYYYNGKVKEALQKMAEAFNCTVFTDRDGVIQVLDNSTIGASVGTYTDSNIIISTDIPQDFDKIYTDVCVKYKTPFVGEEQSIHTMSDIVIPNGGVTLTNVRFSTSPVAFVSYFKITNAEHLTIGDISIGTWGFTMVIGNASGADIPIDIEIFGHPVKSLDGEVTVRSASAYALLDDKEKVLDIDNYLIVYASDAEDYAESLILYASDPTAYITINSWGDMSLELGDVITIQDSTNFISALDIIPIRYQYTYDGGLRCVILAMKTSVRT